VNLRSMHSCRRNHDQILDLAFNELSIAERERVSAQISACPRCIEKYKELDETIKAFDLASFVASPSESYWTAYEAGLMNKIRGTARTRSERRSGLDRVLRSTVRIPLPVAAAVLLAFASTIFVLALRKSEILVVEVPVASPPQTRIVEVPVVHEKLLTRTVYIQKKAPLQQPSNPGNRDEPEERLQMVAEGLTEDGGSITSANLEGFKPADDLRIRVIRRNGNVEK
jgi:anti-sigma factor RsiW